MRLYRIESSSPDRGLWYTLDGSFRPSVAHLTSRRLLDLPMRHDPRYYTDYRLWLSAVGSLKELRDWFHPQERDQLQALGFGLYKYEANDVQHINGHPVFAQDSVTLQERIGWSNV